MQAMILAAGLGKRLLPLTNTTPKPLLLLKGQPIIVHLLKALKQNGIQQVVINVFHLKEQIKNFLQDGKQYGIDIIYSEEQELLDTGGGILNALPLLTSNTFIVVNADIYSNYNFARLPQKFTGLAHLVLVNNPSFKPQGDFSLASNQVCLTGNNMLTYAGIGVFKQEFFHNPPGKVFPLHNLLKRAINKNMVTGEHFTGTWHNIGSAELLQLAEMS